MGEFFESMKKNMAKVLKKAGKAIARTVMPIVFIILIPVIIASGLVYELTRQDASPKQGDMSNVPYASTKYTADVTIDEQGKISTSMTAQELWDEMIKNNSRVDEYLESPEELLKLMSAEIVTSYPDTRPNPDEAIDWDTLNKNINSKETQGIIKFKRAKDDATTVTMSYVDSKTFYDWIEQYNTTGDEATREEIITHFTIEKKADSTSASNITSLDNVLFIGDSITAGLNSAGLIPNATFKAESGTKPSDWLSKIDTLPQNSDDISCVCIMLGVNGTGEIEQMKQLIDSLSARYTGKTIFVQKVLPVANTYTNYETMNEGIKTYNDAISSYCNGKSSVKFIDTSAGYVDSSGAAKAELFDGEGLHPTNYQKLKENIEKAITGKTSSENLSANSSSKYSVVVGAWRQRFEERKAIGDEDPEEEYISGTTTYTMTTQKIDYQSMVSGYTMPFDYLWALLVTGREKDFVMDLADLVYNSEIEITIHDNYTEVTDVDTYEYTRKTKVNTHDITVTGSWSDTTYNGSTPPEKIYEENKEGSTGEIKKDYKIEHTIVTTTNTLDISLTKANVWIVNYAKKYTHEAENTIANEPITSDMPTVEYPDSPEKSDNADPCGIGAAFEKEVQAKYEDKDSVTTNMTCTSDYFYSVEGTVTNNNTVVTKKYTSSPAEITEKTDKNSDTDNFVTLFIDNYDFRNNILSAPDWLFEILEANQKTVDMVDLTKYLIYKATGISYSVTEYDFSAFDPKNFKPTTINAGDPLAKFIVSYENDKLWGYISGHSNDYSSVSEYVSQDRKQYRLYYTSFDGCYNFSYGVMVHSSQGLNNKQYFDDEGIDLQDLVNRAMNGEDVYVDVEIIDRIFARIINDKRNTLKAILEEHGVSMEPHQIDALVSVAYQYGNCGQYYSGSENIAELYKTYYQTGNVEEFKNQAHAQTRNKDGTSGKAYFFLGDLYKARKEATWTLFQEGRYILSTGEEVKGGSAEVVEFALQFVGENHTRFTSYNPSNGVQDIWGEGDWCAMFVSYCYNECGLIPTVLPRPFALCGIISDLYNEGNPRVKIVGDMGVFKGVPKDDYIPSPGDIIFINWGTDTNASHTGIVVGCDGTKIYTVEGNSAGDTWRQSIVRKKDEFTLDDVRIVGYISLNG